MPAQVSELPAGDVEIQEDVFRGFFFAIGAAVLLIYAVLVLLYNDFFHPFTIMLSLPLSIGGALIALVVCQEPLGLYALIGIVMLMGLAIKNSILLVDYCLMAEAEGTPRAQAVLESGEARNAADPDDHGSHDRGNAALLPWVSVPVPRFVRPWR